MRPPATQYAKNNPKHTVQINLVNKFPFFLQTSSNTEMIALIIFALLLVQAVPRTDCKGGIGELIFEEKKVHCKF